MLVTASTEAQIRAINKFNKEKTTSYCLRLNKKTDSDIIQKLEEVGNKRAYILKLIRDDIAKE